MSKSFFRTSVLGMLLAGTAQLSVRGEMVRDLRTVLASDMREIRAGKAVHVDGRLAEDVSPSELLREVEQYLHDGNPRVQIAAFEVLSRLNKAEVPVEMRRQAVRGILKAASQGSSGVWFRGASFVRRFRARDFDADSRQIIQKVLSKHKTIESSTLTVVAAAHLKEALPTLRRALNEIQRS